MASYFDRERWAAAIRRPDWYLELQPEYERLLGRARQGPPEVGRRIADEVYGFFERGLEDGTLMVGDTGRDWDRERAPVDTAVIHHTNLPSGISLRRIDAIHLTRIYARYYSAPAPADVAIRGTPIYSGHFRDGRQTFVGYHWLIRPDGARERLLEDDETGWQAGDWDVNCRSVGICLDGRFHIEPPTPPMMDAVVALLLESYPGVTPDRVVGHREINPSTTCPGELFPDGWKQAIVSALDRRRGAA